MSYFIPSFIQKRLLRYSLSYLGILNTDALSLDDLDITWGQTSQVELKNIGIHHGRVASLLKLPDTCSLAEVRIDRLLLTVPADLHSSGVAVEITGLHCRVDLSPRGDSSVPDEIPRSRSPEASHKVPSVEADVQHQDRRASSDSSTHTTTSDASDATQLASSFLRSESSQEKRILRDAMLKSQTLEQPLSSDTSSISIHEVGVGSDASLPAFLSNFLNGIIERAKLSVRDIVIDFALQLENANGHPEQCDRKDRECVEFRLTITDILIGESQEQPVREDMETLESAGPQSRDRARCISINGLIFNVLSSLPTASHFAGHSCDMSSSKSGPVVASCASIEAADSHQRPEHGSSRQRVTSTTVAAIVNPNEIPVQKGNSIHPDFEIEKSNNQASQTLSHASLDQREDGAIEDSPRSSRYTRGHPPQNILRGSGSQSDVDKDSFHLASDTHPSVETSTHLVGAIDDSDMSSVKVDQLCSSIQSSLQDGDHAPDSSSEDLTQSRFYSHEEALSLYASVFEGDLPAQPDKAMPVPGAWESTAVDNDPSGAHRPERNALSGADFTRPSLFRSPVLDPRRATDSTSRISSMQASEHGSEKFSLRTSEAGSPISFASAMGDISQNTSLPAARIHIRENASSGSPPELREKSRYAKAIFELSDLTILVPIKVIKSEPKPTSAIPIDERRSVSRTYTISVGNAHISADMDTAKLLVATLRRWKTYSVQINVAPSHIPRPESLDLDIDLAIGHVTWSLCTSIKEFVVTDQRPPWGSEFENRRRDQNGALLSAHIDNIKATCAQNSISSCFRIEIQDAQICDSAGPVLSFTHNPRSKVTSLGSQINHHHAISVIFRKDWSLIEHTTIDLHTRPLRVVLDLCKSDETLNGFGGLSSILEVGTSMISTITSPEGTPRINISNRRRAVHFAPTDKEDSQAKTQAPTTFKANLKVDGLQIQIQGQESALEVDTTALKIIKRADIIAVQLDKARLKGPLPIGLAKEEAPRAEISNIRMEYRTIPQGDHLTQLIDLVAPSKLQAEDQFDDSLIIDTLLQQRRKGGLARLTIGQLSVEVPRPSHLEYMNCFISDLRKLSSVAKYLPEDDRPGLLILSAVSNIEIRVLVSEHFGTARIRIDKWSGALVTFPLLVAFGVGSLTVTRNDQDEIVGTAFPQTKGSLPALPVILARYIGDEMEPVVRVRVHSVRLEYEAGLLAALNDVHLTGAAQPDSVPYDMVSSVATITRQVDKILQLAPSPAVLPVVGSKIETAGFPIADILIKDSFIGLGSNGDPAKAYICLTRAQIGATIAADSRTIKISLDKLSLFLNDSASQTSNFDAMNVEDLLQQLGYVFIGNLYAPTIEIKMLCPDHRRSAAIAAQIDGGLLLLETCADSTQTLLKLLSRLAPPRAESHEPPYRTEMVAITDILASLADHPSTLDESANVEGDSHRSGDTHISRTHEHGLTLGISNLANSEDDNASQLLLQTEISDDSEDEDFPSVIENSITKIENHGDTTTSTPRDSVPIEFDDGHFGNVNASQETKGAASVSTELAALKVEVHKFHLIWNLFDGYDWYDTRDKISQVVADIHKQATQRTARSRNKKFNDHSAGIEDDVIGDFLFNSIYIGIPAHADPADLTRNINENVNEHTSQASAQMNTIHEDAEQHHGTNRGVKNQAIKLTRSKYHKMTFELTGVTCNLAIHDSVGEDVASINLKVQDLEVFDHLSTSTWKKFATYMRDAGERESGSNMVAIELRSIRPVTGLAATEFNLKVSVLPLRLHVDQDALDFLSRFFEFKVEHTTDASSMTEVAFIQRAEVKPVRIKLDFKPKRVDYAGLRSGRTSEFMNFFVLDRAELVLRHVILYGVSGFDRLGQTLNDIWTPDVKQNQLPGVLAGVGPIRSLLGVGEGVRDLFVVPIQEYQKDGRVFRSFQKGALTFAKTTTGELARLGARLAVGTQTILQGAEGLLAASSSDDHLDISEGWDKTELDQGEKERISLYSDQPLGIMQGIRSGFANLERDLLTTKDVIIAMPGEIMDNNNAAGAARTVLKRAPIIILRPAVGVSKAIGHTLLGATNSLDPENRKRMEDKYKRC